MARIQKGFVVCQRSRKPISAQSRKKTEKVDFGNVVSDVAGGDPAVEDIVEFEVIGATTSTNLTSIRVSVVLLFVTPPA